jgi:tyrosyl-tRNA synthetase
MNFNTNLIEELNWRGLISDHTPGLNNLISKEKISGYTGFDPTSKSLHIGSLIPIIGLIHLQRAGHQPIALIGGGTGMIGDPSGKSKERNILNREIITNNIEGIKAQLEQLIDFKSKNNPALILDNYDWLSGLDLVSFLRDTGKHFTINYMLKKESVKSRISREDGISFTEFSYMILQAYDYMHLYNNFGCRLQMGGSDQWGNILSGVDLINKLYKRNLNDDDPLAHGLTSPLITNSSGEKFGKTEGIAPTLDPNQTSPYKLYQFFFNVDDKDVIQYLKYFTLLTQTEIKDYEKSFKESPKKRESQIKLAEQVTIMIHSNSGLNEAKKITKALFEGKFRNINLKELKDALEGAPSSKIKRNKFNSSYSIQELCVDQGICSSFSETKRLITQGTLYINESKIEDSKEELNTSHTINDELLIVKRGSKYFHVIEIE